MVLTKGLGVGFPHPVPTGDKEPSDVGRGGLAVSPPLKGVTSDKGSIPLDDLENKLWTVVYIILTTNVSHSVCPNNSFDPSKVTHY